MLRTFYCINASDKTAPIGSTRLMTEKQPGWPIAQGQKYKQAEFPELYASIGHMFDPNRTIQKKHPLAFIRKLLKRPTHYLAPNKLWKPDPTHFYIPDMS